MSKVMRRGKSVKELKERMEGERMKRWEV